MFKILQFGWMAAGLKYEGKVLPFDYVSAVPSASLGILAPIR